MIELLYSSPRGPWLVIWCLYDLFYCRVVLWYLPVSPWSWSYTFACMISVRLNRGRHNTSESTYPRPHFQALQYRLCSVLSIATLMFYCSYYKKSISTIITTLVSPSLLRTSAPIRITIVFGMLGDTRDSLLFGCRFVWERPSSSYASHGLINLRSSTWGKCYCLINLCTWRPNNVYKKKVAS